MKEIGSIRKLDELGRIVIPKSLRDILKIEQGDNIEFYLEDNKIILKKTSQIEMNENELYMLLQLYYLKYGKSSVILDNGVVALEYGKDVNKILTLIENKNVAKITKKVAVKINYMSDYFYGVNIKDRYHFIVYEDKLFNISDIEVMNFIIDYINKLLK